MSELVPGSKTCLVCLGGKLRKLVLYPAGLRAHTGSRVPGSTAAITFSAPRNAIALRPAEYATYPRCRLPTATCARMSRAYPLESKLAPTYLRHTKSVEDGEQ